ncbi:Hpt domain-containing protein [Rhodospirillum sp. A1_3_36]|uniref:Hpt domain-containing protein n=1 Tax=Rhodospirillum sp. A1_3_36 TaxID=3391666 RepID=UPI0039A55167
MVPTEVKFGKGDLVVGQDRDGYRGDRPEQSPQEGPLDDVKDETIEMAENMIKDMREDYLRWAADDLVVLAAIFHELEADPNKYDVLLPEIFRISHDIKGQGGSFGFDLMTRIGNQLCRFLEALDGRPSTDHLVHIRKHMDAMRAIVANRLCGDGGEEGRLMIEDLAIGGWRTGAE